VFDSSLHPRKTASVLRAHYSDNPCFPLDYASLQRAVDAVPSGCSVVVLPGEHVIAETLAVAGGKKVHIVGATLPLDGAPSSAAQERAPASLAMPPSPEQQNCPLIHLSSGTLVLQNLVLSHCSPGTDIWNGNSALYVSRAPPPQARSAFNPLAALQGLPFPWHAGSPPHADPAQTQAAAPPRALRPPLFPPPPAATRAFVLDCVLTSASGRGVVVNKAEAHLDGCLVRDCAATGA
jgi:hypothetical protein